jgi:hypothetical protein
MLRKLALLAAVPIALAACNSITGTQQPNTSPPDKQCLDDLRAVRITHPTVLPECAGMCLVTWELDNVCGGYEAEVLVSMDAGHTWNTCGYVPNGCSKPWEIRQECVGKTALVKVIVTDPIGQLVDVNEVQIVGPSPRPNRNQQRD